MQSATQNQNESATIAVTYKIDEACFMRACHELWAYRAMGRTGNHLIAGFIGFCGAFLLWQGVPGPWAYVMFLGVILFVGLNVFRDQLWRRHYHRLEKYTDKITARIDASGVQAKSVEGESHLPWTHFRSFVRTERFLFLIVDQRLFSVIPLDAFDVLAEANRFEGILINHLPRMSKRYI